MKRMLAVLLMMATFSCAALAEATLPQDCTSLALGDRVEMDIDGDGREESVFTRSFSTDEWDDNMELCVQDEDGAFFSFMTDIVYEESVYLTDLDKDGIVEILLTGDIASMDYFTYCLHFADGKGFSILRFEDAGRGENSSGLKDYGYGLITAIEDNRITTFGSQDALGTWFFEREFTLKDGAFVLEDGGLWRIAEEPTEENWEYYCLTLMKPLKVTLEDGSLKTLIAGTKLYPTATDKTSLFYFVTDGGLRGHFPIAPNKEDGWGNLVNGVSENIYFDYLPYAD